MRTLARCYCHALEIGFDRSPRRTIHCHCGQCRSQSGATFTTWVSFSDPPQPRTGAQALGVFAPTANTMRHFCKICGSHLYTTDARDPGIVGVPFGAIVESTGLVPTGHYFVDDKAPWHVISDGLPQFGGRSGFEPIVPAPAHGRKGD
ncbi:GFA family protein [Variovorax paradoxus]|nr:GFA family protein [Variovorax paradoxus]